MKKYVCFSVCLFAYLLIYLFDFAYAQDTTETPTPAESQSGIQQKINDLKERLTTRVAELKEQNKRAFSGVIKEKDDVSITLINKDIELKINVGSETKINSKNTQGKVTTSDQKALAVGSNAVAFGTLDIAQKILTAKMIFVHEPPVVMTGIVEKIDTKEGSFTITGSDGQVILDYEIGTKCQIYEKEAFSSCGLSKIKPGNFVIVRMRQSDSDITRATALRIVALPNITSRQPEQPAPSEEKRTPTVSQTTPTVAVKKTTPTVTNAPVAE